MKLELNRDGILVWLKKGQTPYEEGFWLLLWADLWWGLKIVLLIAFWACAILGVDELLDYVRVP